MCVHGDNKNTKQLSQQQQQKHHFQPNMTAGCSSFQTKLIQPCGKLTFLSRVSLDINFLKHVTVDL